MGGTGGATGRTLYVMINDVLLLSHAIVLSRWFDYLGNTILLVKLKLWELEYLIKHFGLPLTYAYATLRQSVAGNSTFGVLFFAI